MKKPRNDKDRSEGRWTTLSDIARFEKIDFVLGSKV